MTKIKWGSYADACSGWSHEDKAQRISAHLAAAKPRPVERKENHTALYIVAFVLGILACAIGTAIEHKEGCAADICDSKTDNEWSDK